MAIDCDWKKDTLESVVEMMLDFDFYLDNGFDCEENYVDMVQQWCQEEKGELPQYNFEDNYYGYFYSHNGKILGEGSISCRLYISNWDPFVGYGYTKSQARMNAAESAYNYLDEEGMLYTMKDEIGKPTVEMAISQLHELYQKGYFSMPEYIFIEKHDSDGNPIWRCECHVKDYRYFYWREASSKKVAKRRAAYDMLMSILNADGTDNDNDWEDRR